MSLKHRLGPGFKLRGLNSGTRRNERSLERSDTRSCSISGVVAPPAVCKSFASDLRTQGPRDGRRGSGPRGPSVPLDNGAPEGGRTRGVEGGGGPGPVKALVPWRPGVEGQPRAGDVVEWVTELVEQL